MPRARLRSGSRRPSAFAGIIPISSIDAEVQRTFEQHAHAITRSLTRENLHARIRGLLMMAESNDAAPC